MCESYAARQRKRERDGEREEPENARQRKRAGHFECVPVVESESQAKPCRILFNDMKICPATRALLLSLSFSSSSHITRGTVPSAQKYAAN